MKNFTVEIRRKLPGDQFLPPGEIVPDFLLEFDEGPKQIREMVVITPKTFTAMVILQHVTFGMYRPEDHDMALVPWGLALEAVGRILETYRSNLEGEN